MHSSNNNLNTKFLKKLGFGIPDNEEEVNEFEEVIKEHDIPPIPEHLDSIDFILENGFSNPDKNISSTNRSENENIARAARDGKNIPESILDKMRKDRENAEKNK